MVCVFKDCKNKQRKDNILGISFFRFPRNKGRCEVWRKICNNDTINGLTLDELRNRFVCEIHFNKDDLEHYELPSGVKRKLLRKTAIPISQNELESDDPISFKKDPFDEHKDESCETLGCLERSRAKRKLIDNDSDDISTPNAICKFIEKASGALIDHLDHLLTDPLDKKEDHSYCRGILGKLDHSEHPGPKHYKKILPKRNIKSEVLSHRWGDTFNESDLEEVVLNLTGQGLEKLEKLQAGPISNLVTTLILDNNSFCVLPTLNLYDRLTKVSLVNNQIDSLIWFRHLVSLRELDLSHNRLVDVNGLGRLEKLTHLNLSCNRIKVLKWRSGEATSSTSPLKFLDLSANRVALLRDISSLTNLQELLLHQNELKSLSSCEKFLPRSLYRLTLSENRVSSLCDVSALSTLHCLRHLSVAQNPCMAPHHFNGEKNDPSWGQLRPYDYRPYVLTKFPWLESLDDVHITEDERTKASVLLRKGRIREAEAGNHATLVAFLSEVCPLVSRDDPAEQQSPDLDIRPSTPLSCKTQCIEKDSFQEVLSMPREDSRSLGRLRGTLHIPCKPIWTNKQTQHVVEKTECVPTQAVPCEHLIAVIEEKAHNHRLKRANERLEDVLHQLQQRLFFLEARATLRSDSLLPSPSEFGLQLEIKEEEE